MCCKDPIFIRPFDTCSGVCKRGFGAFFSGYSYTGWQTAAGSVGLAFLQAFREAER